MKKILLSIVLTSPSLLFAAYPTSLPISTPKITIPATASTPTSASLVSSGSAPTSNVLSKESKEFSIVTHQRTQSMPDIFAKSMGENKVPVYPTASGQLTRAGRNLRPQSAGPKSPRTPYSASIRSTPPAQSPILRAMTQAPQSPPILEFATNASPKSLKNSTCSLLVKGLKPSVHDALLTAEKTANALKQHSVCEDHVKEVNAILSLLQKALDSCNILDAHLQASKNAKTASE